MMLNPASISGKELGSAGYVTIAVVWKPVKLGFSNTAASSGCPKSFSGLECPSVSAFRTTIANAQKF